MKLSRRDLVAAFGAMAATSFVPGRLWAGDHLTLGEAKLLTLSDGHLNLPGDFVLSGMDPAEAAAIIAEFNLSTDSYEPPCNVTLLQDVARNILFDVGAGPDFMPNAGKIGDALDAAGLTHDDITHVVFTHGHPDHLWGLLDDFDDPLFANAEYLMGADEHAYWTDPDTVNTIGTSRTTFAVGAARRLEVIADQMQLFEDGAEVLPGVIARASYGHTPGHMSFILHGGGQAALITGDAISNPHVAFAKPLYATPSDQDPETAATTRGRLLDQITADNLQLVGFHLPGGGTGTVERRGDGYRFTPGAA